VASGASSGHDFTLREGARRVIVGIALCIAAACSYPTKYAGIDLTPGAADPQIQSLASRAKAGSKHAQLELGIRYEEGDGVPVDLEQARKLYEQAASDTQLQQTIYVPDGGAVRAETTYLGKRAGLDLAQARLNQMWKPTDDLPIPESASKEDAARVTEFPKLAGGPGVDALKQLIKVEYFSDRCLYDAVRGEGKEQEAKSWLEEGSRDQSSDRLLVSQRCLAKQSLPEDCREFQEEILKVMLAAYADERFAMFGRLVPSVKACTSKTWVGSKWGKTRRNDLPTPLDYILRRTGRTRNGNPIPEAAFRPQEIPEDVVIDQVISSNFSSQYWALRCDLSISSAYRSAFEEVDLIVCSGRDERHATRQAQNFLDSLGVDYAR
jgi:hypothetical protein